MFKTIDKELCGDGHESNGNCNDGEADPCVDFRFCFREFTFLFLERLWGGVVEFKSVVLARWVSQEDARTNIARTPVNPWYNKPSG